jgi:hypothetical protein
LKPTWRSKSGAGSNTHNEKAERRYHSEHNVIRWKNIFSTKLTGNMSKAMTGGGFPTDSPTFKISMREYEDMAIKVGYKITIEINKSDSSSRT